MNSSRRQFTAGVLLIFAVYFYFLIFAQFAFLELVRAVDNSEVHIKTVMAAMAIGGLAGSFTVPLFSTAQLRNVLRIAFLGCSLVAVAAPLLHSYFELTGLVIGLCVGIVTVGVASTLRGIFSPHSWPWGIAFGTGLAYFACNVPLIFQSTPQWQARAAAAVSASMAFIIPRLSVSSQRQSQSKGSLMPVASPRWLLAHYIIVFGILVWLDSAVFYIIQHSPMKAATWGTAPGLWRNAIVHLSAALLTGACLPRCGFLPVLVTSFLALAIGSIAAKHPELRSLTGWAYPAGVSIYSACLVGFPSFGPLQRRGSQIAWCGAGLYAISGWIGSGLGIGMAQDIHEVPWQFIAISAVAIAVPILWKNARNVTRREISYSASVFTAAFFANQFLTKPKPVDPSEVEQGRAVYIAEGCINCHSQYVRPNTDDEILWGPYRSIDDLTREGPPLFGNRRQGPDLLNIGNRRSRAWLEVHFKAPRELSPGSSMPSYEHIFSDARGSALLDYLLTLKCDESRPVALWHPVSQQQTSLDGSALYRHHCAICHEPGAHRIRLQKTPPDLFGTNLFYAPITLTTEIRVEQIGRIIKFGLAGTDMPGHEYIPDQDVIALAQYLEQKSARK
ncbi:MAG TPA: cbb3-type cytochrome c oxidase subunit II [Verrucomicrobiae bacterium]